MIPSFITGSPICGVVERFGAPSVTGSDISIVRNEVPSDVSLVRGGSDMKGCVAGIDVVMNRLQEVRVGVLASRADANRADGETGMLRYQSLDPETVA